MLFGVARKLSIPVLLLSLVGWITYGVGFGLRNFRYKEETGLTAAAPDYIFLWMFLCTAPVVVALSFLQALWESRVPTFLVYLFLPFFFISAGAVFFLDGSAIYIYHQGNDANLYCFDARVPLLSDIHQELNYIPVEFAGAVTSLLFYGVFLLMVPFFDSKYTQHERY